jgi:hypothetical protein
MKYLLPVSAVLFTASFISMPLVWSDGPFEWGEHEENEYSMRNFDYKQYERRSIGVANIDNAPYREECGSCHMAYPPGLLPAVSWQSIMQGLDDHFGDNAALDNKINEEITAFLQQNASDNSYYRRSKQFSDQSGLENVRIRITDSTYFRHEHNKIPAKLVVENPEVRSFSQCNACHLNADQGLFTEHDIKIPGYGRWDE